MIHYYDTDLTMTTFANNDFEHTLGYPGEGPTSINPINEADGHFSPNQQFTEDTMLDWVRKVFGHWTTSLQIQLVCLLSALKPFQWTRVPLCPPGPRLLWTPSPEVPVGQFLEYHGAPPSRLPRILRDGLHDLDITEGMGGYSELVQHKKELRGYYTSPDFDTALRYPLIKFKVRDSHETKPSLFA